MVQFAYSRHRSRSEKIEELRKRSSNGGKRSQEVQAHARLQEEIGTRPTPHGEFIEAWTRYSVKTDKLTRYEIFKGDRANQIDVIVNGKLYEAISWTKLHEMSFKQCCHKAEIVED